MRPASIPLAGLHRLATQPQRSWRRYLVTNTLFLWGAFLQLTSLGYRAGRVE